MKTRRPVAIFVDPDFRTFLKTESAKNNISMLSLTRQIARQRKDCDIFEEQSHLEKPKKFSFKL